MLVEWILNLSRKDQPQRNPTFERSKQASFSSFNVVLILLSENVIYYWLRTPKGTLLSFTILFSVSTRCKTLSLKYPATPTVRRFIGVVGNGTKGVIVIIGNVTRRIVIPTKYFKWFNYKTADKVWRRDTNLPPSQNITQAYCWQPGGYWGRT